MALLDGKDHAPCHCHKRIIVVFYGKMLTKRVPLFVRDHLFRAYDIVLFRANHRNAYHSVIYTLGTGRTVVLLAYTTNLTTILG